jgi:hypothetical protein
MDPHKRSATIEVLDHAERVLSQGRFATDATGYRDILAPQAARHRASTGLSGKTRRQLAAELITELTTLDKKIKAADKRLTDLLAETGTGLLGLYGIGPSGGRAPARRHR